MKINIPTILTIFRIVVIPLFVLMFFLQYELKNYILFGLFFLASFSDWLDGYLARNLGMVTRFGSFLDPVADKLLVATVLILLLTQDQNLFFILSVIIIICREIIISGLREWMSTIGQSGKLKVSALGKMKTAFQMTGISLMLINTPVNNTDVYHIGMILVVFSAFLTIWSMINYLAAAWPSLNEH